MEYLFLLLIPVFLHILYTDVKWRRVHLIAIIVAFAISIFRVLYSVPATMAVTTIILNLLLLGILVSVLLIYSKIRKLKLLDAMAIGDFLFLGIVAINLSPVSFVLFIIISSIIGFIYYLFARLLKSQQKTIPFAGIMAATLSPVIILDVFTDLLVYGDSFLIQNSF